MTDRGSLLAQGIAAVKIGDKTTARRLLSQAVQQEPSSEIAWLWLSAVLDTPQARTFCLQKALALNPTNQAAQRGLAALKEIQPAPTIVARPPPVPEPHPAPIVRRPLLAELAQRKRFWQVVVACLAVVATVLVGILAYATLRGASAADDDSLAAVTVPPTPTLGPRGTLRPTFTLAPTDTPVPTDTSTPTATPTATTTPTPTLTPTDTSTPTSTDTPTPRARSSARTTRQPTATPQPTLPPRFLDPRLPALGVRVEPAFVAPGEPYWRLVEARWTDEQESAGKHTIFIEVLGIHGGRAVGQWVTVQWADGSVALPVVDRPPPDWPADFGMYNTLGSYSVSVSGAPSDRIVGLGLGTAETPDFTVHTCFYLTFRQAYR